MQTYLDYYNKWLQSPTIDEDTKKELQSIASDDEEIKERFFKDLEFGTGGLRGIVGAGRNRMNIYTIKKTTQGFANYILKNSAQKDPTCVISYDPRHNSLQFAIESALTFNANGIKTYIFKEMRPTPQLSFSVRHLGASGGVMVTASHNPPEYNGYKVYGPDGAQVTSPADSAIMEEVATIKDFEEIKTISKDEAIAKGLYRELSDEIDEAFIKNALGQRLNSDIAQETDLKIVYTPLHGAGLAPVTSLLGSAGYKNVHIVEEQAIPDGNFSTTKSPNPEEFSAFELGIKKAKSLDADIVIATDPDSDRVGLVAKTADNEYKLISGNLLGALLAEYILGQQKAAATLPKNGAILTSIVSSNMTKEIAKEYGVSYFEVLTGFKHFGAKILEFEKTDGPKFIYGFEESFGYSISDYQRDKDAVCVALIICEMAAFYKKDGKNLWDAITKLYEKYGYFSDISRSVVLTGIEGMQKINKIMDHFENNCPNKINGIDVISYKNYKTSKHKNIKTNEETEISLPKSNVLYYDLADESWVCIRPSGTEPKIKIYVGTKADDLAEANKKSENILADMLKVVNDF